MERKDLLFGEYVKQRREELGKTMRVFAAEVDISPAYLCDIENGNRNPPEKFLQKFVDALVITEPKEVNLFYDLAGESKEGQHSDINTYMKELPSARMALRVAKDNNFTEEDWSKLIKIIKEKKL